MVSVSGDGEAAQKIERARFLGRRSDPMGSHRIVNLIFSVSPSYLSLRVFPPQRSRRGGGGGGGLFGSRKPAPAAPARRPAPAPRAAPPAPMQQQAPAPSGGGMMSGLASTVAQGMAFGTGSAIAHQAVGAAASALTGGGGAPAAEAPQAEAPAYQPTLDQQTAASSQLQGPCASDKELFFDCLKVNRGDQEACSFLQQQLQACQRNETTFG